MFPRVLILLAVLFGAACTDASQPLKPAAPADTTTTSRPVLPPIPFVQPSRPATIYNASPALNDITTKYHGGALASRYVFFDDSSFALQFSSVRFGLFEYDGRYSRTNSVITLSFVASGIGPWEATGALSGDALNVAYNETMGLSDFIGGVYVRAP